MMYDHIKIYEVIESYFVEYGDSKPFHPDFIFNIPEEMKSSNYYQLYMDHQDRLPNNRTALTNLLRAMSSKGSLTGGLIQFGGYSLGIKPKPKSPAKNNVAIKRPPVKIIPKMSTPIDTITFDIPLAVEYIQNEIRKCDMKVTKYQQIRDKLSKILDSSTHSEN